MNANIIQNYYLYTGRDRADSMLYELLWLNLFWYITSDFIFISFDIQYRESPQVFCLFLFIFAFLYFLFVWVYINSCFIEYTIKIGVSFDSKNEEKRCGKNKPTTSRNTIWRKTKDILSFQWIISISKLIRKMRNAFEMALVMETICCVCGIVVNTLNFAHNLYHLSIHS